MPTLALSKISGVVFVTDSNWGAGANPKSYFGLSGKYQFSTEGTNVLITIGNDQYTTAWADLRIGTGGQIPANATVARVLLNSIFGS